jgi:hypothetical protein
MAERAAVHRWGRFEVMVEAPIYDDLDPLRDVYATAGFVAPSGRRVRVPGFWDGEYRWRVRFAPDETGTWEYAVGVEVRTGAPVMGGEVLTTVDGGFVCVPYEGANPLYRHGPPRLAPGRRHLVHADGTPFFWLADTVWNGPLESSREEWAHYLEVRQAQGFNVAQFISTNWRSAPDGGPDGPAFVGVERIGAIRPELFRRLDARLDETVEAGIVGSPVLLWALTSGADAELNPGAGLSEEDCVLLASYQVARWHAHPVVWILNGDGDYTGERAHRWQRIGRAVFGDSDPATRALAAVHPGGRSWVGEEFGAEPWLDILGYQSGHGGDEAAWRWLADGPPARRWPEVPLQALINLEPCYEHHNRMAAQRGDPTAPDGRFTERDVRRALYWSLLVTPTAGVTYGGHGVWGWDDGSRPPLGHTRTGVPLPWREALEMPGAQQVRHLRDAFSDLAWWTLRPDQALLRAQPATAAGDILGFVAAGRSEDGRLAVLYLPQGGAVRLDGARLASGVSATWINPRDGGRRPGTPTGDPDGSGALRLTAPDAEDWLLVFS